TVAADLDPAGRAAVVRDGGSHSGEGAVEGVGEARDEAGEGGASGAGVGVRDEQLVRIRRVELAAELSEALRRREGLGVVPGAGLSRPSLPTVKLSICELAILVPATLVPSPLKSTCPGCEPFGST